jgi:hypothetical protein
MLNRSLPVTSLATLLLSVGGVSHAQTPAVSLDVVQKYAPTIYLHPYDYPTPGIVIDDVILNSPGVIPLGWLEVANITANSGGGTIAAYHQPQSFLSQRHHLDALAECEPARSSGRQRGSRSVARIQW